MHAAQADSDSVSVATVSGTWDSDDGSDYYLDATIALPHERRLIVSLGQLVIKSSDTDNSIEPITALLGLESDFDSTIPLGVELQYWDDQENITVKTLRGTVGYQFKKANVLFKPQIRQFNFDGNRANLEFSSEGYAVNLGGELGDSVYVYGEYSKHYYSEQLLRLSDFLLLFDYIRLKLVNSVGFSDQIYNLGGSVYFNWGNLNVYWLRSVSALDSSNTISFGGGMEVDLVDNVSMGLSVGAQDTDRDDSGFYYGTLLLSYYW